MFAKQNTAMTFIVGPILDADGAAKTDEVVGSIKVTKNGTVGSPNGSSTLSHDHAGKYKYAANGGDIDTLGVVEFSLNSGTNDMAVVRFMVVPANVYDSLVSGSDLLDANASQLGGTAQTGRDVGASVLLSAGSGAGQLDFSSGVVKSNLAQILGTALTETAGYIAAGFKKLFNVASPVLTAESVNQTGDNYTRLGAPAGASQAADIAANKTELDGLQGTDGKAAISTDAQDLSGTLDVNAKALGGTVQSATDLKDFADAGYDPATNKVQGVVLVDTTTTNTDMVGTDGANTTTPPTVGEIRTEMEKAGTKLTVVKGKTDGLNFTGTDVKATLDGETVTTDSASRTASKADVSGLSTHDAAAVADAVWDEATSGHTTGGSTGKALIDLVPGSATNVAVDGAHITIENA